MAKKWISKILAAAILVASSLIFIPASSAAPSYTWSVPSALTGMAGYSAALSSDGSVMLIGESTTGLYLSTDTGTTFNQVTSPNVTGSRYAVAVSGDGNKMFAVNYDDTSVAYSLDRGVTWSRSTNGVAVNAGAACMSSDGSVWMTGGLNSANAYVSTNNGTSWSTIATLGTGSWRSCALTSNGSKRYFVNFGANLWLSNNSGTNWSQISYGLVSNNCVAVTEDGGTVIQTQTTGEVFTSTNPQVTFNRISAAYGGGSNFNGCSISGTGTFIVVGLLGYGPRLSVNGGVTWATETGIANGQWSSVAVSKDGTKIIALSRTAIGNYIGTYTPPVAMTMGSGAASVLTYRTVNTITALPNYPGRVTFFANGKKIGTCVSVPTVSLVATCAYSPSIHGPVTITARFVPTDGTKSTVVTTLFRTAVVKRSSIR